MQSCRFSRTWPALTLALLLSAPRRGDRRHGATGRQRLPDTAAGPGRHRRRAADARGVARSPPAVAADRWTGPACRRSPSWPSGSCGWAGCASGRAPMPRAAAATHRAAAGAPLRSVGAAASPACRRGRGSPDLAVVPRRLAASPSPTSGRTASSSGWPTSPRAQARRLAGGLNLTASTGRQWLADCQDAWSARWSTRTSAPEPPASDVPTGPVIRESTGHAAPARTFQDLLKSPSDEALFEHYLTSRVARVTLDGQVTPIGAAGLVARPLPLAGRPLPARAVAPPAVLLPRPRRPLPAADRGLGPRRQGGAHGRRPAARRRRSRSPSTAWRPARATVSWREDAPATLFWVEALDGGDAGARGRRARPRPPARRAVPGGARRRSPPWPTASRGSTGGTTASP